MTHSPLTFRSWWQDRVDYRWLVDTLQTQSALARTKFIVGAGGAVLYAIAVLSMGSQAYLHTTIGTATCALSAILAGLWALRWWLWAWPSETESLIWLACADIAITATALTSQNGLWGAIATALLVVPGAYACFHGPPALAVHIVWSLASTLMVAIRLVTGDPARVAGTPRDYTMGLAAVLLLGAVTVVALMTVQTYHWLWRLAAFSDPLTGLLNRHGLDYHLSRIVGLCDHGTIYVATLDLDRFKTVNDTYGHPVGDHVLRQTAGRLRAAADPDALVARTGGEEFVVVGRLSGDQARVVAERLRWAVRTMPDVPVTITASVGVAVFDVSRSIDSSTRHDILRCSDSAMYQAKRLGGNTVVIIETDDTLAF
ncbi:diguanylate cyclase domain-containing protein [Nocardia sp. NPDC051570]|uniref:GGDEF domain-containing protein n=1 Tax=Nocardia sp. NPDC051570 TaxID=3364324 RepID=UPI003797B7F4